MLLLPPALIAPAPLSAAQREADFLQLWELVRDRHPYLGELDWDRAKDSYLPRARDAKDEAAFLQALEGLLNELGDAHSHLRIDSPLAWRYPPFDLVAEWRGDAVVLTSVYRGSRAWRAGLRPGMRVLEAGGRSMRAAFLDRLPTCLKAERRRAYEEGRDLDSDMATWALNSVLAGQNGVERRLKLLDATGQERAFEPPSPPLLESPEPAFAFRRLEGDVGYIRLPGLGDPRLVKAFDAALEALRETKALILDVRDNGGGDTAVTRPLMGRFIRGKRQYAWMAKRRGEGLAPRWAEYVDARGPWTYERPVVVLVDAWSQSVAEGFAMGLDGLQRATVVGRPMARLGAGTLTVRLRHSKLPVGLSVEPVFHVDGRPRNAFRPKVLVDLATPDNLAKEDPILEAAQAWIAARNPTVE